MSGVSEGEETSHDHDFGSRGGSLKKTAQRVGVGEGSVQVCVFTRITRETFFIVLIVHIHIFSRLKQPSTVKVKGFFFMCKPVIQCVL